MAAQIFAAFFPDAAVLHFALRLELPMRRSSMAIWLWSGAITALTSMASIRPNSPPSNMRLLLSICSKLRITPSLSTYSQSEFVPAVSAFNHPLHARRNRFDAVNFNRICPRRWKVDANRAMDCRYAPKATEMLRRREWREWDGPAVLLPRTTP
jgi:hypothetical protein